MVSTTNDTRTDDMRIEIVPTEACPTCGAYDGHPNDSLNFPNRPKVDNNWKCYNPVCPVGFYADGVVVELKPSPEEAAEMNKRVAAEVEAMCAGKTWTRVDDGSVGGIEQWELR
jgi:hypothetical protein